MALNNIDDENQDLLALDLTNNQLRERLDNQLLANPIDDDNSTTVEMSVKAAARHFKRSSRQVRRLLQSGKLNGYKVTGPNGPEWRVYKHQTGQTANLLVEVSPMEQRLGELEKKLDRLARKFAMQEIVIQDVMNERVHLNASATANRKLQVQLDDLKKQVQRPAPEQPTPTPTTIPASTSIPTPPPTTPNLTVRDQSALRNEPSIIERALVLHGRSSPAEKKNKTPWWRK